MCLFDKLSEEVTVINENVFERLHHAMKLHATMKYAQEIKCFFFLTKELFLLKRNKEKLFFKFKRTNWHR